MKDWVFYLVIMGGVILTLLPFVVLMWAILGHVIGLWNLPE